MGYSIKLIRKLREYTGEGLMACKEALDKHDGDYMLAVEHLRCIGQLAARSKGARYPCGCLCNPRA